MMDKQEALNLLRQGLSTVWNDYRNRYPNWKPDLAGEDLSDIEFVPVNKDAFNMTKAILVGCTLPSLNQLLAGGILRIKREGTRAKILRGKEVETYIAEKLGSMGNSANILYENDFTQSETSDTPSFIRNRRNLFVTVKGSDNLDVDKIFSRFNDYNNAALEDIKFLHYLEEYSKYLSGALIDHTTTLKGGGDIEILVKVSGVRFVTQDELIRERANVTRKVFISYAWADDQEVSAIEQWLREKGLVTMIDRRDFFAGEAIKDEIVRSMSDADAILLFHSEKTANKPWIEFERTLARKFEETASQENKEAPQIIYVVLDDTSLPDFEKEKIAIMARGRKFPQVCQEIYDSVLRIPRTSNDINLSKWEDFVFP